MPTTDEYKARVVAALDRNYRRNHPKPRKASSHPERQEQVAICDYLDAAGIRYWSTPNEARRSYRLAATLKATGLVAGAPDLTLVSRAKDGRPVAIETKAPGGKVTPAQASMHTALREAGWHVLVGMAEVVIRGLRELGL